MEELLAASELLKSALANYVGVCSNITKSYNPLSGNLSESRTLMDCIIREIQTMVNYRADIQIANSFLSQCRNSCPAIAPIHTLPTEVLARIFTLVHADSEDCLTHTESGMFERGDPNAIRPKFPHILSHVCSRWRQVAVGSRRLWSHIDLTASNQQCAKLLPQAELYSVRAEHVPLSLHIFNPHQDSVIACSKPTSRQVSQACTLLAPRTQRFRLDNLEQGGKGLSHLLYYFLRHAEPTVLRELRLLDHGGSGSTGLLEPKDSSRQYYTRTWQRFEQLWLSTRAVDKRLLPVEVLWLRNVFFPWSCHVYIGLTDLRLIADRSESRFTLRGSHIHISQLAGILASCPGLRIFHCNLCVDTSDTQPAIPPVPLKQLEVVNLHRMASTQSSQLLSHIAPGGKPLELSLFVSDERDGSPWRFLPEAILDFFRRSRVTELFLHKDGIAEKYDDKLIEVPLARLLSELPTDLCTLGLNRFRVFQGAEEPRSWPSRLSTVYMRSWNIDFSAVRKLASVCSLRELMLSHSPVESGDRKLFKEEVTKLVPIVNTSWSPPERWKE